MVRTDDRNKEKITTFDIMGVCERKRKKKGNYSDEVDSNSVEKYQPSLPDTPYQKHLAQQPSTLQNPEHQYSDYSDSNYRNVNYFPLLQRY